MKTRAIILTVAVSLSAISCGQMQQVDRSFPHGRWIDLSHAFSQETLYWPTAQEFSLTPEFQGVTEKGYFYASFNYQASEHGGTHLDAPFHFSREGRTVEEIPVSQLIGPAVVVDVSQEALKEPDYRVTPEDFIEWESEYGRLPPGGMVLINTGYHRFWPDKERYLGTADQGPKALAKLHFPGLHPEAARWLVRERSIGAIGLDTPSIDYGQSTLFKSHRILFKHDIPAFENVAHLDRLPPKGALVMALPMKIEGGSGAPLRIVAFLPEGT